MREYHVVTNENAKKTRSNTQGVTERDRLKIDKEKQLRHSAHHCHIKRVNNIEWATTKLPINALLYVINSHNRNALLTIRLVFR